MSLFQSVVVDRYVKELDAQLLSKAWQSYAECFLDPIKQDNIRLSKEEQYQAGFLRDLFTDVFGYTLNPNPNYNLTTEFKNQTSSKKADGAILKDGHAIGVIELKGMNTTDMSKIETQAFGYKNNQPKCRYVITANFQKLRLYIDNAVEFEEFDLFTMTPNRFALLYLLLHHDSMMADLPAKIKSESLSQEEAITKQLYKDYSVFKRELFADLTANNPAIDALLLFQKSQKLLDRLLFIFFAEDSHLLPANFAKGIINEWQQLKALKMTVPLYDRVKAYFGYLDQGHKDEHSEIFAYNGGLFRTDSLLDSVIISDELLRRHILILSEYDFASEVDVNILGHIFENSLSELDEVKAQLAGEAVDKSQTKRKKDGVFYTPKYITKYIVENTIGKLCTDKKSELFIVDEDFVKPKKLTEKAKETLQAQTSSLECYREWLLQITVCDPACGSGAFLNEALNFLIAEHSYIDELHAKLYGDSIIFPDIENSILENNLFGVDINEESVEIAKLSLWLRTAQPRRKLNNLNDNIQCGNSLIDDPVVAGDKAFNWQTAFPQVFAKGGFDVVIGNPPYGATLSNIEKNYLEIEYSSFEYQVNTYVVFYEKGMKILNNNGLLGFITPATFTYQHYFKKLRAMLNSFELIGVSKYLYEVFDDADIGDCVTWIMKKSDAKNSDVLYQICRNEEDAMKMPAIKYFDDLVNSDGTYALSELAINFHQIQETSTNLINIVDITAGIKPYQKGKGVPKQTAEDVKSKNFNSDRRVDDSYIQCIVGKDIKRYGFQNEPELYLSYGEWLAEPRGSAPFFDDEKIILRQTSDSLICNLETEKRVNLNNIYNIGKKDENISLRYILAIMNSKLLNLIYQNIAQEKDRTFAEVKKVYLSKLPIKDISLDEQKFYIIKTDLMLSLNQQLHELTSKFIRTLQRKFEIDKLSKKLENWHELTYADFITELSKKKIKMSLGDEAEWEAYFLAEQTKARQLMLQIETTDSDIDQMVYKLYNLTDDEIAIIEAS